MALVSLEHLIRTKLEAQYLQAEHTKDLAWLIDAWRVGVVEPALDDWTKLIHDREYWEAF